MYTLDGVRPKGDKRFKEFLEGYLIKKDIDFHLLITLEPTEKERIQAMQKNFTLNLLLRLHKGSSVSLNRD
ncbi:MAG: hypothetical protein J7J44_07265 [Deltaproteobacteria bacterium]|nr:hypothetical protein [Deltaproteobacteria bacterium]